MSRGAVNSERVRVTAPSRLHFGLLSWGNTGRQFGGAGVMLAHPALVVDAAWSDAFCAAGPHANRVVEFAQRWSTYHGLAQVPSVRLDVRAAPPEHVGLGLGTQLGLAVAAALQQLHGAEIRCAAELALSVGRGLRSAIGSYGFLSGGFVFEEGKLPDEPITPLAHCRPFPTSWRFVLVRPDAPHGVAGESERQAFAQLPPVPAERTEQLRTIVTERIWPALDRANCDEFGEALFEYGWLAGECFASIQGGPFHGARLHELVDRLRGWGIRGVGQSSWGPTLYALVPDELAAERLVTRLRACDDGTTLHLDISPVANSGASIVAR